MLKGHLRVLEARNLLDLINARQKIIIWPKSALHNPGKILCREWPKNRKTGKFMRPRVFGYGQGNCFFNQNPDVGRNSKYSRQPKLDALRESTRKSHISNNF